MATATKPATDAAVPAEPTASEPQAQPIDRATLLAELDRASDDPEFRRELRTRRFIGGIAGEIANATAAERQAEQDRTSRAALEAQMMKDAQEDPEGFATKWLAGMQKDRTVRELSEMKANAIREHGLTVGKAIADTPEFKELTPEDVAKINSALVGVPEEQVLAVYSRVALDLIADKRADKKAEAQLAARVKVEVEAATKAANAKRVATSRAPVLKGGSAAVGTGEPREGTPEWSAWYEQKYLGRRA